MRIAILGRTRWLLDTAAALVAAGHRLVIVATAEAAPEYGVDPDDFAALAVSQGAPFYRSPDANDPDFVSSLQASGADVAVSINWPMILGREVCEALPHGILNAHAGDLPRYRGNACPNWAIINGETQIGLCAHRMEPGIVDSGPIFARRFLHISEDTYIADVYAWMNYAVPELLLEAVSRMSDGDFVPEPQEGSRVRPLRCYPRRPEDGRIDWSHDATSINRLVRASSRPFRGAYTWLEGKTSVTIWRARLGEHHHDVLAVPGQIMGRGANGGILIACGTGTIEIEEAEMADGSRLPAANRHRLMSWPASREATAP